MNKHNDNYNEKGWNSGKYIKYNNPTKKIEHSEGEDQLEGNKDRLKEINNYFKIKEGKFLINTN